MKIRSISWLLLLLAVVGTGVTSPAIAQFSPSYKFLESVRKKEAEEVTDAVSQPGSTIINTQDSSSGDTALHIVVARRDPAWLGFLLAKGADPNIANNKGVTPLMLASNLGLVDAVELLVEHGARLNDADSSGETPLITAVHRHDLVVMRMLMKAGADPDRADSSGRSARDYAAFDGPQSPLVAEIKANARAAGSGTAGQHSYGPKL
ncbi:MAG: ankyrin repeat domain-containing protein [Pseudomonadota bacterium]|nr:ankyrin repeat domain-containing protein [Pseudomonadota bacterium]